MATGTPPGSVSPGNPYSVVFDLPHLIKRGINNTIRATVVRNGQIVAPAGGGVTIYDASNTLIVNGGVGVVTGGRLAYTVPFSVLGTDQPYESGWRFEWALVMTEAEQPDGAVYAVNDGALVRRQLHPVITDGTLNQRLRGMDHTGRAPITTGSSQDAIDEAWIELNHRLINQGRRPNLVMTPSAFRNPHLFLALAIRLDGMGDVYKERADGYRRQYEAAWNSMTFLYDSDDDGEADSVDNREGGTTSVWIGS